MSSGDMNIDHLLPVCHPLAPAQCLLQATANRQTHSTTTARCTSRTRACLLRRRRTCDWAQDCRKATTKEDGVRQLDDGSFTVDGARLAVGDDVFLLPDTFDQLPAATADDREAVPDYAAKSRHVKTGSSF